MAFELPQLPYATDALEPHIDTKTMEIHHGKHHAGYTNNLNNAIAGTELEDQSIEGILANIGSQSAGVRNNGGGFYRKESYIHEARMNGGNIHAPCINNSRAETVIYEKEIFLGFLLVNGLENKTIQAIQQTRDVEGAFTDLYNFIKRVSISKEQLNLLIRVGAFRFTTKTKKELLWEGCLTLGEFPKQTSELFDVKPRKFNIPKFLPSGREDMSDEIELLGFPLLSPFNYISETREGKVTVNDMRKHIGKMVKMLGYYVFHKTTKTSNGEYMCFGTFTDEEGAFIDSIHFSQVLKLHPFKGLGVYLLEGVVAEEFNYLSLNVRFMKRIPYDGFL